jgi:protein SCO1
VKQALVLGFAIVASLVGPSSSSLAADGAAALPQPPALAGVTVEEHPGERVPLELVFEDVDGDHRALSDFFEADRPVLLVMAYASCPMLCNLVLRGVADAVRGLPPPAHQDVQLVTVSIDPDESPDVARRKQANLAAAGGLDDDPGRWAYLRGSEDDVRALARSVGFSYRKDPRTGEYAHPAVVFVLTPSGTISSYAYGLKHDPAELSAALGAAAAETTRGSETPLEAILSCFRFDPADRKYGTVITRLFQGLALVVVIGGAGTMGFFIRRRRRA